MKITQIIEISKYTHNDREVTRKDIVGLDMQDNSLLPLGLCSRDDDRL